MLHLRGRGGILLTVATKRFECLDASPAPTNPSRNNAQPTCTGKGSVGARNAPERGRTLFAEDG
eukprot:3000410-Pyramimonas_sp.AAC.1